MSKIQISYEEELDVILGIIRQNGNTTIIDFKKNCQTIQKYYEINDVGLNKILEHLVSDGFIAKDSKNIYITEKGKFFSGYKSEKYLLQNEKKSKRKELQITIFSLFVALVTGVASVYIENSKKELVDGINQANNKNYNLAVMNNNQAKSIDSLKMIVKELIVTNQEMKKDIDMYKIDIETKKSFLRNFKKAK